MKLWRTDNLTEISSQNKKILEAYTCACYQAESDFRVGIVGGGPKGAYSIERLASVWNSYNPDKDLDIVCFNKSLDFACGPNYQTDQPDFLLMNYHLGKINFWTEEQEQLVDDRPDLQAFLERFKNDPEREVVSSEYCSRAVTGIYLQYCLSKVIEALPPNIRLHLIVGEVRSIKEVSDRLMIKTEKASHPGFEEVMCCTGHAYSFEEVHNSNPSSAKVDEVAPKMVQQVYPVQRLQAMNYARKTVAIKGMGLTFVDAVLAVTEGRGGSYKRDHERMTYLASGEEPQEIFAFSRTGLPMIARQDDLGGNNFFLRFFTEESVKDLVEKQDHLDFKLHLLPLIQQEFRYQYVAHLLRFNSDLNIDSSSSTTLQHLEGLVSRFFPDFKPFDLEEFLSPKFPLQELNISIIGYLEGTVFPERFDALHQSRVAMSALWREIYPLFNKLYSFGKLRGESQRYFDQNYFGRFQRVAYGPPKENMEKILALANAGILKFDLAASPKVSFQDEPLNFKLSLDQISHSIEAHALIDARIPKSVGISTQPEYIRNLVKENGIDFFINGDYKTGSLEIDHAGRLIKQQQICFYGTPTEGWTLDNESLSRTNNNFLSPWAKQIVRNNVTINTSEINADYPPLGSGSDK